MSAEQLQAEHAALIERLEVCESLRTLLGKAGDLARPSCRTYSCGTWKRVSAQATHRAYRRATRTTQALDFARPELHRQERRLAVRTFNALVDEGALRSRAANDEEAMEFWIFWRRQNGPRNLFH